MRKLYDTVLSATTGAALQGVQVLVYQNGTGSLATIFKDKNSTPTDNAGYVTTDANGYWEFYSATQLVDLEYRYGGTTIRRITDVELSSLTADAEASEVAAAASASAALGYSVTAQNAARASGLAADTAAAAQAAVLGAISGVPSNSQLQLQALTRTALAAITSPTQGRQARLSEAGAEGDFTWDSGNHATDVTLDPSHINYMPPASDTTGVSGAWVRTAILASRITATDGLTVQNEIDRLLGSLLAKVSQRVKALEEATIAYLPTLTTAGATYYAVYGTKRLVSGSTMALARGIRNSNSAATDLAANADAITLFSIKDIRGAGTNAKFDKWYDQTANARDLTQTTAANRPVMHEDSTINGIPAMTFAQTESNVARLSYFLSPTISLARADFTVFLVMYPTASMKDQSYFRFLSAPSTNSINLFHTTTEDNGRASINLQGAGIKHTGVYLQASPHVFTFRGTASAWTTWLADLSVALGATSAETMVQLELGVDAGAGFGANWRCGAMVLCDKGLNDADVTAVTAVLRRRFRLSTDYDAGLVYSGTSRTVGGQADNAFSKLYYEQKQFTRNPRVINLGQDGQALSTTLTHFASRGATAYESTRPMIYVIDDAINDLGGLGSSTVPATIYGTTITGLVNAAKALGSNVRVVVRTTLPQDSTGVYTGRTSAAIEADRITLNALIRANAAGADVVTDTAAITTMGVYPTNPDDATKYVDKLHHTALGNSLLAPVDAAGIDAIALP